MKNWVAHGAILLGLVHKDISPSSSMPSNWYHSMISLITGKMNMVSLLLVMLILTSARLSTLFLSSLFWTSVNSSCQSLSVRYPLSLIGLKKQETCYHFIFSRRNEISILFWSNKLISFICFLLNGIEPSSSASDAAWASQGEGQLRMLFFISLFLNNQLMHSCMIFLSCLIVDN